MESKNSKNSWTNVVKHPTVVTALVTTIFGSLGVAYITNSVNQSMAQRDLQVKIVEAIIEYTKVPDFTEASAISKLDALTQLLADNRDKFELEFEGFRQMVRKLQEDALVEKDKTIGAAKVENQKLLVKLKGLADDSEQKRNLETQIAENQQKINSAQAERSRLANALQRSRGDLETAQERIAKLEKEVATHAERTKPHQVRIKVTTEDPTKGFLSFRFQDSLDKITADDLEFAIPATDRETNTIEREVAGNIFLTRKYVVIENESCNEWDGEIELIVEGELKFKGVIVSGDNLQGRIAYTLLEKWVPNKQPTFNFGKSRCIIASNN